MVVADWGRWADPDLWGHVRFGQAVLAHGHVVTRDTYSYSAPGHLFLDHEWLSDVLMAWLYNTLGVVGLKLMKLLCSGLTVVFLAMAMGETGAGTLLQFAVLLLASVSVSPQMQFRPQVFTFAALSGLLVLLARHTFRGRAPLWIAIPLLGLWANLHGGFIIGLATLGLYSVVVLAEDVFAGRGPSRAVVPLLVTAGATAATLLTPYGSGTWYAVFHALVNPYTRVVVDDWQSIPSVLLAGGVLRILGPVVLFATLGASLLAARRGGDVALLAVAAMMIVAAFTAIRNLPIAVIASVTPLARHLALALEARRSKLGIAKPPEPERSGRINQAIVSAIAVVLAVGGGLFSTTLVAGNPYPVGAVRFMKQHRLNGNILDHFAWGDYLIWHMAPESKVFIDGRYDTVYPQQVLRQFLLFHFDKAGGAGILEAWPHDFVMIAPDSGANRIMQMRRDWKLIYSDSATLLYARAGSPATQIPGVPIAAGVAPASSFP
ncbi:MAG: hypothetical protein WA005_01685 [Candidatus Binataceae bacterium]